MPLEYSSRAMVAYAQFYAPFNEKSVFVEDEAGRIIHERLIAKTIGAGRVSRVVPLKGRDFVLEQWSKNRENENEIYIIDGDLNLIYGSSLSGNNLFSLDVYCVENYLFNSNYLKKVLEDYVKDVDGLDEAVEAVFLSVIDKIPNLIGLFILYSICHFKKCGTKSVKEGGLRFFSGESISEGLIFSRKKVFVRTIISKIGRSEYLEEKSRIKAIVDEDKKLINYISGKHFLFPIIHKLAEKKFGFVGSVNLLARQCSRYFDPSHAPEYSRFLRSHFPDVL